MYNFHAVGGAAAASANNTTATSSIVQAGLLAEYRMEEGSGTSLVDSSGNGNHGTFATGNNAPVWDTVNGGIVFNTESGIKCINLPTALNNAKTIAIFALAPQLVIPSVGRTSFVNTNGALSQPNANACFVASGSDGYNFMSASAPLAPTHISPAIFAENVYGFGTTMTESFGGFHMFTMAAGSPADSLYIDDRLVATYAARGASTGFSSGSTNFKLGGIPTYLNLNFCGSMFYVLFYDRKLSDKEVAQNYKAVKDNLARRGITFPVPLTATFTNRCCG